ncbi:gamma-mobile-trio protein GmtX [Bosea sp. NPDC055353]
MNDQPLISPSERSPAADLYRGMLEAMAHARSRQTLTGLWSALQEMRAANVPDYSIARVGKFCEKYGGPKSQSIRNASGAKFRRLIETFANDVGSSIAKLSYKPQSNIDRAIDDIRDFGSRTAIRMIIERSKRLERENDELRSAFKNLSVAAGPTCGSAAAPDSLFFPTTRTPASAPELEVVQLEAITKFLSDEWMQSRFWSVGDDGSIVDEVSGSILVAPPGFVDGLRRVMDAAALKSEHNS